MSITALNDMTFRHIGTQGTRSTDCGWSARGRAVSTGLSEHWQLRDRTVEHIAIAFKRPTALQSIKVSRSTITRLCYTVIHKILSTVTLPENLSLRRGYIFHTVAHANLHTTSEQVVWHGAAHYQYGPVFIRKYTTIRLH